MLIKWISIVFLAVHGNAILNQPANSGNSANYRCDEFNQQLTCNCTKLHLNVFNVTTFQLPNVHSNSVHKITITNCARVIIQSNVIAQLKSLRYLEINDVQDLHLRQRSLHWEGYYTEFNPYDSPRISILISNSQISLIEEHAFGGVSAELKLHNVQIQTMQSYAFSSQKQMRQVVIQHCQFHVVNLQAFKKLQTEQFVINNSTFWKPLPSRAFVEIDVSDTFKIANSRFDVVKSNAFIVKNPKRVEIQSSYFNFMEGDSFVIQATGIVLIKNNTFSSLNNRAFLGITLIKEHRNSPAQELTFDGNKLNQLSKDSLLFNRTSFTPRYGVIILNQTCSCVNIKTWLENNEWREYVYCLNDSKKATTVKATVFNTTVCESSIKTWVILVIVFSVLLLLLIVTTIIIVFIYRKHKKRQAVNGNKKNGSLGLILPDGRTYRETEVHVIIEKAELLTTEL